MGIDPELLKKLINTFKTELNEQLQFITNGILLIEKNQTTVEELEDAIASVFRSAHNIKGTSRSLGINKVSDIAHHIESLFSAIQKKTLSISPKITDICLEAVDKMKSAMEAYIDKADLQFNLDDFLQKIDEIYLGDDVRPQKEVIKEEAAPIIEKRRDPSRTSANAPHKSDDTVRVSIENINRISSIMEEIQANKIAMDDYYKDVINLHKNSVQLTNLWKLLTAANKRKSSDTSTELTRKLQDQGSDLVIDNASLTNQLYSNMRLRINELAQLSSTLQDEVRTLRLLPADYLLCTLPRFVRDLSQDMNKKVDLVISGQDVKVDKIILESLRDPIIHLIRNCIDHGIESPDERKKLGKTDTATISLNVREESGKILITVSDDGSGIDLDKIKRTAEKNNIVTKEELALMSESALLDLIFRPGFSTKDIISDISGRGVGLDVVRTNIEGIKGYVTVKTKQGQGTSFELWLPLTLVSEKGLVIKTGGLLLVVPITAIQSVLVTNANEILFVQGRQAIRLNETTLPLYSMTDILNIEQNELPIHEQLPVVVIKSGHQLAAFIVDEIIDEHDIVIKPLQPPLNKVPCISGGTLFGNNQVILVVDSTGLLTLAFQTTESRQVELTENTHVATRPSILVVDDSITTRTLEKNILESKNYNVTTAVNGKEAWEILQNQRFDLVITDVTMPIMDGFTLTEKVKKSEKFKDLPVIIVTSLGSDAEKKRGIDAGANAYIIKSDFESGTLLTIIEQLV